MTEDNVARLCLELDRQIANYADQSQATAIADATYRTQRAKRVLRARAEGVKSISEAELTADADDLIAEYRFKYLAAAAHQDATGKAIMALRERIGFGRTLLANRREADRLHADFGAA